jgi:hypothetical protein
MQAGCGSVSAMATKPSGSGYGWVAATTGTAGVAGQLEDDSRQLLPLHGEQLHERAHTQY